jgi:hypothetical protein
LICIFTRAYKFLAPACSCVTSRGIFTLIYISNSTSNLKAEKGGWNSWEKQTEKRIYKYRGKKTTMLQIILRDLIFLLYLSRSCCVLHLLIRATWNCFWCYLEFVSSCQILDCGLLVASQILIWEIHYRKNKSTSDNILYVIIIQFNSLLTNYRPIRAYTIYTYTVFMFI